METEECEKISMTLQKGRLIEEGGNNIIRLPPHKCWSKAKTILRQNKHSLDDINCFKNHLCNVEIERYLGESYVIPSTIKIFVVLPKRIIIQQIAKFNTDLHSYDEQFHCAVPV